jgi:hypothetical protein
MGSFGLALGFELSGFIDALAVLHAMLTARPEGWWLRGGSERDRKYVPSRAEEVDDGTSGRW